MASDHEKNFYISRRSDSDPCHHALRLHRRDTAIMPTGVFHCSISDHIHTMTTKHLYVGIYGSMSGGWCTRCTSSNINACLLIYTLDLGNLSIVSLVYSDSSLICTSTGGPATNVTWTRVVRNGLAMTLNGSSYEQSQILVYTENATYVNVLHSIEDDKLTGTIRCTVSNVRSIACRSTCNG